MPPGRREGHGKHRETAAGRLMHAVFHCFCLASLFLIGFDFGARGYQLPAGLFGFDKRCILGRCVAYGLGGVAAQALGSQRVFHGFGAGVGYFGDGLGRHVGGGIQAISDTQTPDARRCRYPQSRSSGCRVWPGR